MKPDLHPEIDRLATSKKKVPQEFLDKIENHLMNKTMTLERLREEKDDKLEDECPFVPAISNNSRAICDRKKLKPVQERYQEEIVAKKNRIKELQTRINQQKVDQEEKENQKSIHPQGKKFRDTYKYNVAWYEKKNQKIVDEQVKRLEETLKEKEHIPNVNHKSLKAMAGTKFEDRQENYNKRRKLKIQEIERKTTTYSHSPSINKKSAKMVDQMKKRKLINQMVTQIEENERHTQDLAEETEKNIFVENAKTRPQVRSTSRRMNTERLYKTPGKKKIIATLPQKSRNPTLEKDEKDQPRNVSSLKKTTDLNRSLSPKKPIGRDSPIKTQNTNRSGVKFVEDIGSKSVTRALKDKGRLYTIH